MEFFFNKFVLYMFSSLNSHNIFPLSVGHFFAKQPQACYVIYAPLKDLFFLVTPEEAERLELNMQQGIMDDIFSSGRDIDAADIVIPENSGTLTRLFLLLNEKCNFHCRYCYSAGGRSKDEISESQMKIMVDQVIKNSVSNNVAGIEITFMGGGEPLLSLPLIEATVHYAEFQAREKGKHVRFSISTNGSLVTSEVLDLFLKHSFDVQVSFEILPDVQNDQRGQYTVVHSNILRMLERGLPLCLRSTITDLNVDRMKEMVKISVADYPQVKTLVFEPVVDTETYSTSKLMKEFYNRFTSSFHEASHLAKKHGLTLSNSAYGTIRILKKRFCSPIFCLTPFGTLMDCPNVSSPLEPGYMERIYGNIHHGEVRIDKEAYMRIMTNYLETDPRCQQCWAKWNCGGGCRHQRLVYNVSQFEASCCYFKEILLQSIISDIAEKFQKQQGKDFFKHVASLLTSKY